jgi:hypothetical protein
MSRAVLALIGALALSVGGCGAQDNEKLRPPLESAINGAADDPPRKVVVLSSITPFAWDRVMIEQLTDTVGATLRFEANGQVVREIQDVDSASFACFLPGRSYSPAEMRFFVIERRYPDATVYRLLVPAAPGGLDSRVARRCITENHDTARTSQSRQPTGHPRLVVALARGG